MTSDGNESNDSLFSVCLSVCRRHEEKTMLEKKHTNEIESIQYEAQWWTQWCHILYVDDLKYFDHHLAHNTHNKHTYNWLATVASEVQCGRR